MILSILYYINVKMKPTQKLKKEDWIEKDWKNKIPKLDKTYTAQVRYHSEFLPCQITVLPKNKAKIIFTKTVLVASGQSCVFYNNDICLGGGIVV